MPISCSDQIMFPWRSALTSWFCFTLHELTEADACSTHTLQLNRPSERTLLYMPGLVVSVRREKGQRDGSGLFKDVVKEWGIGEVWSRLLFMHEPGLQGQPAGCPALIKPPAPGHSSLLYDVKSTDLCYGYQSELTFTMGGMSQVWGALAWHTCPKEIQQKHYFSYRTTIHFIRNSAFQTHTHVYTNSLLHHSPSEQAISTYAKGHICNAGDFYAVKTQVIGGGGLWYLWRIVAR